METTKIGIIPFRQDMCQSGRTVGNTTRQIDYAIQLLFEGNRVMVVDHYESGEDRRVNMRLFSLIIDRLRQEHYPVILDKRPENKIGITRRNIFIVDRNKLTIELVK